MKYKPYKQLVILILLILIFAGSSLIANASTTINLTVSNSPQATNSPVPNGSSTTSPSGYSCTDIKPSSIPVIYIAYSDSPESVVIKYTSTSNDLTGYAIEYGIESGNYKYAQDKISINPDREYKIGYLQPNTKYYVRMRAGNGCATGDWSNEISVNTKSVSIFNNSDYTKTAILDLSPVVEPTTKPTNNRGVDKNITIQNTDTTASITINIAIRIVDNNNNPINKAKVTLFSDPKVEYTDEEGNVLFKNVETGQHQVEVDYGSFHSEQSIYLNKSYNNATVTLQGESVKSLFQYKYLLYILLPVITIILVIIFLRKRY